MSKRWKQPKCPWMDEWISAMWYIDTMEYYLALERKEILTHAIMWVSLEDMMLSEISQTAKGKYCMISLTCGIQKS